MSSISLLRGDLLEPVAGVDLAAEVVAGHHVELGAGAADVGGEEVVVGRFEDEGDPADAALDGDELERREAGEHSGEEQVDELEAVGHEELGGEAGVGDLLAVDAETLGGEAVVEVAGADVEGDRHVGVDGGVPDRVPVVVAEEGLTVGTGGRR